MAGREAGHFLLGMPATMPVQGVSPVQAKALARRAYDRTRAAGGLEPVVIDRLWADTVVAVAAQPTAAAAEMLRRTEDLFILNEDRASWPR